MYYIYTLVAVVYKLFALNSNDQSFIIINKAFLFTLPVVLFYSSYACFVSMPDED